MCVKITFFKRRSSLAAKQGAFMGNLCFDGQANINTNSKNFKKHMKSTLNRQIEVQVIIMFGSYLAFLQFLLSSYTLF